MELTLRLLIRHNCEQLTNFKGSQVKKMIKQEYVKPVITVLTSNNTNAPPGKSTMSTEASNGQSDMKWAGNIAS